MCVGRWSDPYLSALMTIASLTGFALLLACLDRLVGRNERIARIAIEWHFNGLGEMFIEQMGGAQDARERAAKIRSSAHTQECWHQSRLAGLVALYENDRVTRRAYITYVGVIPEFRRRGVARRLLERSMLRLRESGMRFVELEVRVDNGHAFSLYQQFGFEVREVAGRKAMLRAEL
jgi:ribosomal protein S18 acetylase RimI-like enzyme